MVRRVPEVAAGNLPAAVTSFVGRRREIGQVRSYLSASRLVTLTGPGGVGKTRLALEVAMDSRRAFADGVWLVDLAPVNDGALLPQAMAAELGAGEHSTRPVMEQLLEFFGDRQMLILLDNCEHVLDGCVHVLDPLLRRCPGLRVLATSRQSIGISGEYVYPVPSLTVPDLEEPMSVAALGRCEAVGLLVERAAAVRPGFAVTEANCHAVARLCAELDGIPLAIELAATRLRSLSVEQVVDRLADRFELLTGGSRAALPRQRTLRALIDWSYDLCAADERRLWARLSVFAGGFDLESAEQVCADDGVPAEGILDLVDGLISRSIVARVGTDQPRFRMLETIRQYGEDRLIEFGEQARLRERHRAYFLQLAQRTADNWCGPGQEAALARLRAEHGNLRAVLEWSCTDPGEAQLALQLCGALRWHWCADGFVSEGGTWLDRVLALPAEPSPARAQALWVAGWVALLQGNRAVAQQRLDECRRLAEQLDDRLAAAHALSLAGSAAAFTGHRAQALTAFRQAIDALAAFGENGAVLLAMFQLAAGLLHSGDIERASATARAAINISERCGERWARSYALWVLARCTWHRGELAEAWRLALAALELQRGFRDLVGAALMIEQLAWIAAARADFARAACLLGTAHSVWRSTGTDISAFGPGNVADHEDCERATRQALREPAFKTAFQEGMQRSGQQAIDYVMQRPASTPGGPPQPVLTRREREVACLVGQGMSNRQIAERLVLSPRTVDGHVEHILVKLGCTSRTQIAAWVAAQAW